MSMNASIADDLIEVTVTCSADLQEASVLPLPGSLTISGSASEVRDAFRERSP
jgi:hypothetical protein